MRQTASSADPCIAATGAPVVVSAQVEHDDGRVGPALRLLGWVFAVVVSVALVRILLVQSFVIPSASMEPTLQVGDRVLVSRLDVGSVRRGDVVVFDGRGVFDALYEGHRRFLGGRYDAVVTEIATRNGRSMRAHARAGFETIHVYRDATDEWAVVAMPLRGP